MPIESFEQRIDSKDERILATSSLSNHELYFAEFGTENLHESSQQELMLPRNQQVQPMKAVPRIVGLEKAINKAK